MRFSNAVIFVDCSGFALYFFVAAVAMIATIGIDKARIGINIARELGFMACSYADCTSIIPTAGNIAQINKQDCLKIPAVIHTTMDELSFRDRFVNSVLFNPVDRLPERHAYGLMPGVIEQWHAQGLPESVDEQHIREYFGFPAKHAQLPLNAGPVPALEERVVEETSEFRIATDVWGRKTKIMKGVTTIALGKEFPVRDRDTWLPYKERLQFSPDRIGGELHRTMAENAASGNVNTFGAMGFYWFPRDLMGDEALAVSYYTQPDLIHDINDTWCSLLENLVVTALRHHPLDVLHLNEDMAYKNASMVGKSLFDEFIAPYYQRFRQIVEAHNIPVFSVDSDGCLNELIYWFRDCGVNLIGPNEVQAGNSIVDYRNILGDSMAFDGGLDKRVLPKGRAAIDDMLDAIVPAMMTTGGGWIVSLDHRIVPDTTLDDFVYYLERVRELIRF